MADFSVGSFASSKSMDVGGQSFTPNVPGPNGSGSPGSATAVLLDTISVGYPTSDPANRSMDCYVYSVMLDDQDEVGQTENLIGKSDSFSDGSVFGANSFSRKFNFLGGTAKMDPTQQYYIYFDEDQYLRIQNPNPYTGGNAWDADFDDVPDSIQFQVTMTTSS